MGNRLSRPGCNSEEKKRSDGIDRRLEEDGKRFRREFKILLLGHGDSGRSTVVKQMKIIYKGGFSESERASYAPVVYRNVLDSALAIIYTMRKRNVNWETVSNRALADKIFEYVVNHQSYTIALSPEIAEAIHHFWQDPAVTKVVDEHGSKIYLNDSAEYFFSEVLRIGSPGYVPNEIDVLRARWRTTSITETRFEMGKLSIHMFEVRGQRSERRKWTHCFEVVNSILFVAALSYYDQVDFTFNINEMQETLVLFEGIVNSRWFLRSSIILFLNKVDVFKKKLSKVPLERHSPNILAGTISTRQRNTFYGSSCKRTGPDLVSTLSKTMLIIIVVPGLTPSLRLPVLLKRSIRKTSDRCLQLLEKRFYKTR
ncbi:G-alpha-domain-containing protein [Marasmius fiardii PR-910]|nr:G-alpha-domain-containing protein [Marasmius fiardii PR-910]